MIASIAPQACSLQYLQHATASTDHGCLCLKATINPIFFRCHAFVRVAHLDVGNPTLDPNQLSFRVRALQVSVGRLGVITELDFEIVPQQMLVRTAVSLTIDEAVDGIAAVSSAYAAVLAANASASQIQSILAPLDMTQACGLCFGSSQAACEQPVHT